MAFPRSPASASDAPPPEAPEASLAGTLIHLWPYIWPSDRADLKMRVMWSVVLLSHMRATQFIRQGFAVEVLKAERVEDILPRLRAAAALVSEEAMQMAPEVARRL